MNDQLDELRALLDQRADRAPDPTTLLSAIRRAITTRRRRRRTAMLGTVVTVTALLLVGANLLADIRAPRRAATSDSWLATPKLPFTVGTLPIPVELTRWTWDNSGLQNLFAAEYIGPTQDLVVQWTNSDPAPFAPRGARITEHGTAVTIDLTNPGGPMASWSPDPGHWLTVQVTAGSLDQQTLISVSRAVEAQPSTPPTALRLQRPHAGLVVTSWAHATPAGQVSAAAAEDNSPLWLPPTVTDYVTLCPPNVVPQVSANVPSGACYTLSLSNSPPSPPGLTDLGPQTTRQIDATHRVQVQTGTGDAAMRRALALAASVG